MNAAPSRSGLFVTLEGGEGSGKSTLSKTLAEMARKRGVTTLLTREPGGTAGAEAVRHVLLSGAAQNFGSFAEAVLFAAARTDHLREVVRPALAQGLLVLCDRFMDSTRAYQGLVGGVDAGVLNALDRVVVNGTKPHLTLVLDIDPDLAVKRRQQRNLTDRFENEDRDFHFRLREAYLTIARAEPRRCRVLDASQSAESLAATAWRVLEVFLPRPAAITPS